MPQWYDCSTAATTTNTTWPFSSTASSESWIWFDGNSTGGRSRNRAIYFSELTPEQQQAQAEQQRRAEEWARQLQEAKQRAEELLLEALNPVQRLMYEQAKRFIVEGSAGGQYAIRLGRQQNIVRLDDSGREIAVLCCHPREAVPDPDTVLTQKLWLEAMEPEFLQIANVRQL